jgi:hypothetical protein
VSVIVLPSFEGVERIRYLTVSSSAVCVSCSHVKARSFSIQK